MTSEIKQGGGGENSIMKVWVPTAEKREAPLVQTERMPTQKGDAPAQTERMLVMLFKKEDGRVFFPPAIKQGSDGDNIKLKVWVPQLLNTKPPKKREAPLAQTKRMLVNSLKKDDGRYFFPT
jgi:hypothetical protein